MIDADKRIRYLEELIRKTHGPVECECFKGTWKQTYTCPAHLALQALGKELQERKDEQEAEHE